MKKSKLRQIIKEEYKKVISENMSSYGVEIDILKRIHDYIDKGIQQLDFAKSWSHFTQNESIRRAVKILNTLYYDISEEIQRMNRMKK
jgi:hypothetical protein